MVRLCLEAHVVLLLGCVAACANKAVADDGQGDVGETESDGGDGDGEMCGLNLHANDSTCGNGKVDAGELCFRAPFSLVPDAPRGWFLEIGDFNADGHVDILGDVYVYLGDGTGKFSEPVQWGAEIQQESWSPAAATVGNADGKPGDDIFFTAGDLGDLYGVSVVFGGPAFPTQGPAQELPDNPIWIAAGDLSGDGLDDAVIVVDVSALDPPFPYEARYALNDGGGNFSLANVGVFEDAGVADVNGDGHFDMVLAGPGGTTFMFSNGGGGFSEVPASPQDLRVWQSIYGSDIDCDGRPDVVFGNSGRIEIWAGMGGGEFDLRTDVPSQGSASPSIEDVGDANGDGALDLLSVNQVEARVFLGDSAFGLEGPIELPVVGWKQARFADFNEDGAMDFVGLHYTDVEVVLAEP